VTAGASKADCGDELPGWSSVLVQEVVMMMVVVVVAAVVEVRP